MLGLWRRGAPDTRNSERRFWWGRRCWRRWRVKNSTQWFRMGGWMLRLLGRMIEHCLGWERIGHEFHLTEGL